MDSASNVVDLSHTPSQIGTAILHSLNGDIVKSTGDLYTQEGQAYCTQLYRLIMECKHIDEPIKKVTISHAGFNYIMTTSDAFIYIVKKQA